MNKTLISVILVFLIITGFGANATSFLDNKQIIKWKYDNIENDKNSDEIDQIQNEMDWFGPVGPCPLVSEVPNYYLAQSFIPTKNVLTRIELMLGKNSTTIYDYRVAIRNNLDGQDLTSISLPASQITTENFSWEVFDIQDIVVSPGDTYYIISSTVNSTDNWYAWGLKMDCMYPGTIYYSIDDEETWSEEPSGDMTFITYGYNNQPPQTPSIEGQLEGTIGKFYTYSFSTTDPEIDDVYYYIDWGDGSNTGWIGSFSSGIQETASHSWSKKGTYIIKIKAKDILGAESDWGTLLISMPIDQKVRFANSNFIFIKILQILKNFLIK